MYHYSQKIRSLISGYQRRATSLSTITLKYTDVLLVISHPDDDAIFAGELQKRWNIFNWSVVCVTRTKTSKRGRELLKWQKSLGTDPSNIFFLGFKDDPEDLKHGTSSIGVSDIEVRLKALQLEPKLVVTHNDLGEYGHPHHKTTHQAVGKVYADKRKLFFGYGKHQYDMFLTSTGKNELIKKIYRSQACVVDMFYETHETFIWS